jgi:LPPG:FO 2-phospho-L-lactate transferase
MMDELGLEVSGAAIARRYADIIHGFVIDAADAPPPTSGAVTFFRAATLMAGIEDRLLLARAVLQAADALAAGRAAPSTGVS